MKRILLKIIFSLCLLAGSQIFAEQNILVFLGPPGAGKGTMSKKLSQASNLPHISTGDLLREKSKQENSMAEEIKGFMASGQLVPDDLIVKVLLQRVKNNDCAKGFILDGFPRTKAQAEKLTSAFPQKDHLIFVNVTVGDNTILERLQGRLICKNCSKPYHVTFHPPATNNQCDDCEGALVSREDDNYDVIKKRLEIYKAQYAPVKKFLKDNYQWIEVRNDCANDCYLSLVNKIDLIDPFFLLEEN